jgi:hypothetical protein
VPPTLALHLKGQTMTNTYAIIVFPDGETWNTVDGSSIKIINEATFRDIVDDRIDAGDAPCVAEINLADLTPEPKD